MTITNGYTTLNDVKAALRIVDAVDDGLIELAIETSSREIDGYCNRIFYNAGTAARYFAAQNELVCDVDDLAGTAITLQTDQNADGNFALDTVELPVGTVERVQQRSGLALHAHPRQPELPVPEH
jgi:hypothetical protein